MVIEDVNRATNQLTITVSSSSRVRRTVKMTNKLLEKHFLARYAHISKADVGANSLPLTGFMCCVSLGVSQRLIVEWNGLSHETGLSRSDLLYQVSMTRTHGPSFSVRGS